MDGEKQTGGTLAHTLTHFLRGPASMFALMSLIRTVAHANKQQQTARVTTTTTSRQHQRQLVVLVNDLIKFSPIPQRSSAWSTGILK